MSRFSPLLVLLFATLVAGCSGGTNDSLRANATHEANTRKANTQNANAKKSNSHVAQIADGSNESGEAKDAHAAKPPIETHRLREGARADEMVLAHQTQRVHQRDEAVQGGELVNANSRDDPELFVGQPTIRPNPIERAPLIAIIEFESSVPVIATLQISDGQQSWEQPGMEQPGTSHRLAAVGLRPGREHTIRVRLEDPASGREATSRPLTFSTPPLPASFPPLEVTVAKPSKMEPGVTLFAVNLWRDDTSAFDAGYMIALDQRGEVVWYCHTKDRIADIQVTHNGHLLYQHGHYRYAYEIDILGRDIRRWFARNLTVAPSKDSIPVGVDTMHHALFELPNGHLMTLTTQLRSARAFPSSEFDRDAPREQANVVTDRVIEFVPETGEIVDQLNLADFLDPERIGYLSLGAFWNDKYKAKLAAEEQSPDVTRDWSHANALEFLPEENAILVSFRHLDCILKIDWQTKQLRWILGDPNGWGERWQKYLLQPVGEGFTWFYHQHAPHLTPRGTLLLYDNGNYRARPFQSTTRAPDNYSRVAEFKIDEQAMTVEEVFEYWGPKGDRFYSPFYGEADWLPKTTNLLVTDGGHIESDDGTPRDDVPGERQWARIFEIRRSNPPEKVFEVVFDSGLESSRGWSIYRANRLPNLIDPFDIDPPAPDEEIKVYERKPHVIRRFTPAP